MRATSIFADTVDGGRGKLCVAFDEPPPIHVLDELSNNLGTEYEIQGNGRLFKFYCCPNNHVPETKFTIARMALHRAGYERHDGDFFDQENADECWGCRQPGHPNYI